jgi:hypothetical protein
MYRARFQIAITEMSMLAANNPRSNIHIKLRPCVPTFDFERLLPVLTDEAALDILRCNYQIQASMISRKRLKLHIDNMTEDETSTEVETRKGNANDVGGIAKTQKEQRQETRDKKNIDS